MKKILLILVFHSSIINAQPKHDIYSAAITLLTMSEYTQLPNAAEISTNASKKPLYSDCHFVQPWMVSVSQVMPDKSTVTDTIRFTQLHFQVTAIKPVRDITAPSHNYYYFTSDTGKVLTFYAADSLKLDTLRAAFLYFASANHYEYPNYAGVKDSALKKAAIFSIMQYLSYEYFAPSDFNYQGEFRKITQKNRDVFYSQWTLKGDSLVFISIKWRSGNTTNELAIDDQQPVAKCWMEAYNLAFSYKQKITVSNGKDAMVIKLSGNNLHPGWRIHKDNGKCTSEGWFGYQQSKRNLLGSDFTLYTDLNAFYDVDELNKYFEILRK